MEPFNNFDRWTQLKNYVESNCDLYQLLQDFWQVYSTPYDKRTVPKDLENKIEDLGDGNTRHIYRIGKTTEYEFDCGFGKMVLICKLPARGEHENFSYPANYFPTAPDLGRSYAGKVHPERGANILLRRPLMEAQSFEEAAVKGKNIPKVTGIIAGNGILGTLTQDVSEGDRKEIEFADYDRVYVIDKTTRAKELVYTDRKGHFPLSPKTDYYFHRLQIDNPFKSQV